MPETNGELAVERMASRCDVDLDQQVLVGAIGANDLSNAAQKCGLCSKKRDCQALLDSGVPLVEVPSFCSNSAFFKRIERLASIFWTDIEFDAPKDSAVISIGTLEESISLAEAYVELESEGLWVESWASLERQSRSWAWHYKCDHWLLEHSDSKGPETITEQTPARLTGAVHNLGSNVLSTEFFYWLANSVAKAMDLGLKAAVETKALTQTQYANMVLECCLCPLHEHCQTWLNETQVPADTCPPGCANSLAFEQLFTFGTIA